LDTKIKAGRNTKVILFKDLDDVKRALKANEVDIIICIPEEFIKLRESVPLKPVLSSDYGKHFYDDLILLVRNDSGISQLEQLRRKNLRIESGQKGTLPMKWLDSLLMAKLSTSAQKLFANVTLSPKASQVVLPLFFGQTDASLVSRASFETMVELNPQLGRTLRILEKSPRFATGIIAVRRDVSDPQRDVMVAAFRDIHTDPKGRQILTLFRINRLVDFKAEHLSATEKVLKEHHEIFETAPGIKRHEK
jgi:phosphonate transport system substrate-binding protein